MRELLHDVLLLQLEYSPQNTPAMQKRGRLVRDEVAAWVRAQLPAIEREAPGEIADWKVQAKDATGNKSVIPWVRVYSAARSPRPTEGWYVVYLFGAQGDRVYLSLMQGTSRWVNGEFKARPQAELRVRAQRARDVLSAHLRLRPDLVEEIALKASRTTLGPAYEAGTVAAFEYSLDALPSDGVLGADLIFLASVLSRLYEIAPVALDEPDEIADALIAVEKSAGKARRGQGFSLTAEQRTAVERRAVAVATQHLVEQGYAVTDVGATQSYDLDARRGEEHLYVEVKGTTGPWTSDSEIIVTKNEVDLHLREYPNTMLLIVSSIELDRAATPPSAAKGELKVVHPWRIVPPNLTPLAYRYLVGE
ncbi:DUF3578 domain-containing protein [Lentzea alba]|uniref:MrcB family domain-containing protein n=1 Tax=Lentzea alba TaxID=2714351 RepID=UPI0039BFA5AF